MIWIKFLSKIPDKTTSALIFQGHYPISESMTDDLNFLLFIADKMFYAVVCGIIVGFERKLNRSPAAFKTQILICVGSMLFTAMPSYTDHLKIESARVIAQIVSGVGFLGAGAIIRTGSMNIMGLTTAAWIWFTASMGIMIGLNYGMSALFITTTLTAVISLMRKFERSYFDNHEKEVVQFKEEASEVKSIEKKRTA